MKSTQGSHIQHNAAWRAFWIKIRELSARETDRRREEMGDQDNDASAVAADGGNGLRMTADEKGRRSMRP